MATIGATLKLFDQFSNTMTRAEQTMQSALQVASRLKQALQGKINLSVDTKAVSTQIQQLNQQIQALKSNVTVGVTIPSPPTKVSSPTAPSKSSSPASLFKNMKSFNQMGQKLVKATIGGAMEQQNIEDMFKTRTGDDQVGSAMFQHFKENAQKSGMDINEALKGTLSFFPVTKNTDHLDKMNNFAQILSAYDSSGKGVQGASLAVKGAMSGNTASLTTDFGISKSAIRQFKIEDLAKSGNIAGLISAFDKLLENQKMTKANSEKMLASPVMQTQQLKNNLNSAFADAGTAAMQALMPIISMINTAFKDGKFKSFFTYLSNALALVAQGIVFLVDQLQWLWSVMQANWPLVQAILISIATVISGILIASIIEMAFAWITAAFPVLLVVAAIALLIYILQQCGVTTEQIVGFIVGSIYMLGAYIYNQISFIWNIIASFAEFFSNVLTDPFYAIKKLIYDLAMAFSNHMYIMILSAEDFAGAFMKTILQGVNKVIEGINWLSKQLKIITGVDLGKMELFDENNVHAVSDKLKNIMDRIEKPKSSEDVISVPRIEERNLKNSFNSGYSAGVGITAKMSTLTDSLNQNSDSSILSKWNSQQKNNIGTVDQVGKIQDKVDVSSEDLKVMRDLADIQNIQNFVTLTPTVQVTTGDINQSTDVNEMIRQIEEVMEREVTNVAQRSYS